MSSSSIVDSATVGREESCLHHSSGPDHKKHLTLACVEVAAGKPREAQAALFLLPAEQRKQLRQLQHVNSLGLIHQLDHASR